MSRREPPSINPAPVVQVPAAAASNIEESGIDLWQYLRIIRGRIWLVMLTVLVCVGMTAFVTLRLPKTYRATVTLRIDAQEPKVLGKDVDEVVELGSNSLWFNLAYYETQYKILSSRDIAERVVKELRLNEDPDFMLVPADERLRFKPAKVEEAAEYFQALVTVEPVKESMIVRVHVDNPDPARAQLFANTMAKAYVDRNLEAKLRGTVDAVDWLAKQLDDARTKLAGSEQALYGFKKENDILSISVSDRQNILTSQMESTAAALSETRAKRIELQSRKAAVARVTSVDDPLAIPVEALNSNSLIQQLKERYGALNEELGELSERYGERFPRIIEIKAKMQRIRADIGREVRNILNAIDAELDASRATEAGLQQALNQLRDQALALNQKEVDYNRLAREVTNNERIYDLLLGRAKEADLSRLLRVNNIEILDPAVLPFVAISPRVGINIILSLVLGLVLGVALALIIEFADSSIKTQEDVERLGLVLLGIVPAITPESEAGVTYGYNKPRTRRLPRRANTKTDDGEHVPQTRDLYAFDHPKSQVAECCRAIRTNLLFMSPDRPVRRLLFTSPSPQEGKTTVTVSMAIIMAQSGSRVLLVDTDMRRPRIHHVFGVRPKVGISTMVLGESTLEESVIATPVPNLYLLPCGPTPPNPAEMMLTERFRNVVEQLSLRFDRVLFDSPPVAAVTDAAILSKMVDGTVLVFKSLQTSRDAGRHAVNVFADIGTQIMGVVLNDVDLHNRKYGHYYYYYYKKYGYYYGEHEDDASAGTAQRTSEASTSA